MLESAVLPHVLRRSVSGSTHYRREGHGTAVILIHGVGMDSSIWSLQIEALAQGHDVIAYDMLGHGGTTLPPTDARLSDYADQLLSLMDRLDLDKAHVVGHSMGALVALEFALTHAARCRSVTALNAVYCRTPEQRAAVEARALALADGAASSSADGALARWFGNPVPAHLAARADMVRNLLSSVDPVGYARTYSLFARSDDAHRGRLETLAVPSLFATGELDPNSTPAMSEAMAAAAPNARCEILRGERHVMALTATATVNHNLRAFIDAVESREYRQADRAPAFKGVPPMADQPLSIDPKAFRQALGAFVTGVTVVSTLEPDGAPRGFTANSFASVSLDPPLVLVCIAKTASSYPVFSRAAHFSISVLAEAQKDISSLFASKASDKFALAPWRRGATGSPIIDGAAAWFDCRHRNIVEAGDHIILIGEVVGFDHSSASPLGYCRGAYIAFSLSQAALAGTDSRTRVGAILEREGALLLVGEPGGVLDLPTGSRLEPESDPASLRGVLKRLGLDAKLGFLFAVFEDPATAAKTMSIYYRGVMDGTVPAGSPLQLVPFEEIPWSKLRDGAVRSMLQRYVREREEDAFGIYVGDTDRGTVQTLVKQGHARPIDGKDRRS
jgi:(E)-2-((N-methylformamido)methylene)succinate hydrolase